MGLTVPRTQGTVVLVGGGWPFRAGTEDPGSRERLDSVEGGSAVRTPPDEMIVLSDPCRVLVAEKAKEIPALLDEVADEQARGRHVAGYLCYEAGAAFGLTVKSPDPLPLAWMAVYPEGSVSRLSAEEKDGLFGTVETRRVAELIASIEPKLSVSRQAYSRAIRRIKELIAAGDTYQVNYTVRARFELDIDPLEYFLALVLRQPVPYAAFLDTGESQVLSLSPELFLRRRGTLVESMPMKGTRPRAGEPGADAALAEELIHSEKDRAENLMIVDMVRNDLGRVSRAGSIAVPTLFSVEPYRTVWQMASTVTGKVRRSATPGEIIAATFPGASITGAPKHHTMEIISELETEPRGVYTGTVGLFLPSGDFTCNLAIRTLVHHQGSFRLGVGGGIVWDSDPRDEYQEALTKASFALPSHGSRWEPMPVPERVSSGSIGLFETILLEGRAEPAGGGARGGADDGAQPRAGALAGEGLGADFRGVSRYSYLEEHMDRMEASALRLGLVFDRVTARAALTELADITPVSTVVRLQLDGRGELRVTTRAAPVRVETPIALLISPFRTDPHDLLLAHKVTTRHLYDHERERAQACGCLEALFLNHLGRVTEGAVTNVFLRSGRSWLTPPVSDGLLPGIWRAHFLREVRAVERSLTLDDLLLADEIVVGNSVRGAMPVGTLVINCLEGIVP